MCLIKQITKKQYNDLEKLKTKKEKYQYIIDNIFEIAQKDIIVTKQLLKKSNRTPYYCFKIKENTHYYQTDQKFTFSIASYVHTYEILIFEGLHSYTNNSIFSRWAEKRLKVVKAIIPKGSLILKNDFNTQIVSDNLIFHSLKSI